MAKAKANRRKLTEFHVSTSKPQAKRQLLWDTECRGLALAIEPSGTRAFKFVFSRFGRPRWLTIGRADAMALSDARREARAMRVAVDQGKDPAAARLAIKKAGSLGDLVERYIAHQQTRIKSWRQTAYYLNRHLVPALGQRAIGDVSRIDVEGIADKLVRSGKKVTARQFLRHVSGLFVYGLVRGLPGLDRNPVRGIETPKTQSRDRVLSDAEIQKLWPAFETFGPVGRMLKIMLLVGLRAGNCVNLDWAWIDGNWLEIPGEQHKNGRPFRTYLSGAALAAFGPKKSVGRVFDFDGNAANRAVRELRNEIGLTGWRPHDLRRSTSTSLARFGVPPHLIEQILGHAPMTARAQLHQTYNRYSYDNERRAVLDAWSATVAAIVAGRDAEQCFAARLEGGPRWRAWAAGDEAYTAFLATREAAGQAAQGAPNVVKLGRRA